MTPAQTSTVKAFVIANMSAHVAKSEWSQIAELLSTPWATPTIELDEEDEESVVLVVIAEAVKIFYM